MGNSSSNILHRKHLGSRSIEKVNPVRGQPNACGALQSTHITGAGSINGARTRSERERIRCSAGVEGEGAVGGPAGSADGEVVGLPVEEIVEVGSQEGIARVEGHVSPVDEGPDVVGVLVGEGEGVGGDQEGGQKEEQSKGFHNVR